MNSKKIIEQMTVQFRTFEHLPKIGQLIMVVTSGIGRIGYYKGLDGAKRHCINITNSWETEIQYHTEDKTWCPLDNLQLGDEVWGSFMDVVDED